MDLYISHHKGLERIYTFRFKFDDGGSDVYLVRIIQGRRGDAVKSRLDEGQLRNEHGRIDGHGRKLLQRFQ